jgi:large subunit ribosomal protein L17
MRHRVASKQLNRDTKHRESLFKNLMRELVEHGSITTTLAKAKVVRPMVDKVITKAKPGDVAARRLLHQIFGKRDVVNTLIERVVPAFKNRNSGFTRITPVGLRAGDNTMLVQLTWVDKIENVGTLTAPVRKTQPKASVKKAAVKPAQPAKTTASAPKKAATKVKKSVK